MLFPEFFQRILHQQNALYQPLTSPRLRKENYAALVKALMRAAKALL